eukprot:gnl/MRDRNA2_/MRDRNA2_87823_c0_seq1.p1 gnl/MRDRNA2_/MRDRNA2_87823_c0~~gnl/MRDRNA2_/MRDRNA2_87823_c0_seq1.p1  ORF type:complete len:187 (-),score=45.61 gnl/MRDRNA2_/MRDRNA2_87823_c0_seq1:86-646(-)
MGEGRPSGPVGSKTNGQGNPRGARPSSSGSSGKRGKSKGKKANRLQEAENLILTLQREQDMLQRHCKAIEKENEQLKGRLVFLEEENEAITNRGAELEERARQAERILDDRMQDLGKRDSKAKGVVSSHLHKVSKGLNALRTEAENVIEAHGFQDILHGQGQEIGTSPKLSQRQVYSVSAARKTMG